MQIISRIQALEKTARQLEPHLLVRQEWHSAIEQYANEFIEDNPKLNAFDSFDANHFAQLEMDIPKEGRPIEEILAFYKETTDRVGINPASGKHFGYVPGGGVMPSALGDYLAAITNRYAGIFFANPGSVKIENQLLRWMCKMIAYPTNSLGNLCSGGSIANLIAVTTARDARGINSEKIPKAVAYMTNQVHHCVQKAMMIAGMREVIIRYIDVDEALKMDVIHLRKQIAADKKQGLYPFLVVSSAGTTNTGVIDPLDAIADIAEENDLWYHIDAAYGGFFLMLEEYKHLFKGVERSDSFTIDPHKGLFLSYGLGAILVKDTEKLYASFSYTGDYMQDAFELAEEPSPADLSPELTKHFRGLRMWLSLQLLGTKAFRAALEEKILLCQYFHKEVQKIGFEVGPQPDLSITVYRYVPTIGDANLFNQSILEAVRKDGRVFLSSTTIDGVFWIRLAVLSFRAHLEEVQLCLEILSEVVNKQLKVVYKN